MAGCVLIGMFAAFGIFCSIWIVLGRLLQNDTGGTVICPGRAGLPERSGLLRWLYLMETGLIRCPIMLVDLGIEEPDRIWLRHFGNRIEICTPEELLSGLELERNKFE